MFIFVAQKYFFSGPLFSYFTHVKLLPNSSYGRTSAEFIYFFILIILHEHFCSWLKLSDY